LIRQSFDKSSIHFNPKYLQLKKIGKNNPRKIRNPIISKIKIENMVDKQSFITGNIEDILKA